MRITKRARRAAVALVTAAAVGGSGVAVGAATAAPATVIATNSSPISAPATPALATKKS